MKFVKYHGCGNDAILFDETASSAAAALDPARMGELVRRACHRTMGIGGDVVLLVLPPDPGESTDARMRIFNSDGNEAQMCSTGVRAVVKRLIESRAVERDVYRIQTGRGVLKVWADVSRGVVKATTIHMGSPIFEPERIPVRAHGAHALDMHVPADIAAMLCGPCCVAKIDRMSVLSTGNPHAVFFCPDVENIPLTLVGPAIERHAMFPQRVNVHFVRVLTPTHVRMRTWERGAGATLACGTGACAVVAAGVRTGRLERRVRVDVPGGEFAIAWDEASDELVLTGPIVEVCRGEWSAPPEVRL